MDECVRLVGVHCGGDRAAVAAGRTTASSGGAAEAEAVVCSVDSSYLSDRVRRVLEAANPVGPAVLRPPAHSSRVPRVGVRGQVWSTSVVETVPPTR
jgi:hypothetical protein